MIPYFFPSLERMPMRPLGDLLNKLPKQEVAQEGDGLSLGLSTHMMKFFSMPGPFIVCVVVVVVVVVGGGGGGDRPLLGMSTHMMTFFSMHGPFIDVSMSVCVVVGETGYHWTHDEVLHACAIYWCISVGVCVLGGTGYHWAYPHTHDEDGV